jgi:hypothetical protein
MYNISACKDTNWIIETRAYGIIEYNNKWFLFSEENLFVPRNETFESDIYERNKNERNSFHVLFE